MATQGWDPQEVADRYEQCAARTPTWSAGRMVKRAALLYAVMVVVGALATGVMALVAALANV